MDEKKVRHIVCAVRGRPQGRETVSRAIDLALEHNARLTFVLVMDAEFLGMATPVMSPLRTVYTQLEAMGDFALLILVDRATRKGVQEVDSFVLKGDVRTELRKLAESTAADMLILGRPDQAAGKPVFQPAEFDEFISDLQARTGLQIVPVAGCSADSSQAPEPD